MTYKCEFCKDTKIEPGIEGPCIWCETVGPAASNTVERFTIAKLRFAGGKEHDVRYVSEVHYDAALAREAALREELEKSGSADHLRARVAFLTKEIHAISDRLAVAEQRNASIVGKVSSCKDCGSADLFWFAHNTVPNGIQHNRLNTHDVECVFFLGCNHCSATLKHVSADMIAEKITAALKPAVQHQGEPVAYTTVGMLEIAKRLPLTGRIGAKATKDERWNTPLFLGPAEQPAPVAVVMPFAEKVIGKLQRFHECMDDSQGADIGRHWFDLLTQLGLLNRVQRSPALWEITDQGEEVLEVARLNGVKP